MSVVSPYSVDLALGDDDQVLPVQVPVYKLPNSFDPAAINPINGARLTRVMKDGQPLVAMVKDPVNQEIVHKAEAWLYSVPADVFPYLRTQAAMYSDVGEDSWNSYIEAVSSSPVSPILVDILSIVVNWYELNMPRLMQLRAERAVFVPSAEDLDMISGFFQPNYTGDESQKLLFLYMALQSHLILGAREFERVLQTWFAELLDGKSEKELRQLTGAVNDTVQYDEAGNVIIGDNGQPVPSAEALAVRSKYPVETREMLNYLGLPLPEGLEDQIAIYLSENEDVPSGSLLSRPRSPRSPGDVAGPSSAVAGPSSVAQQEPVASIGDLLSGSR